MSTHKQRRANHTPTPLPDDALAEARWQRAFDIVLAWPSRAHVQRERRRQQRERKDK